MAKKGRKKLPKYHLTNKMIRFAQEIVKDGNGSKAAIRAGYARGSSAITATKLLKRLDIQEEIEKQRRISEDQAKKASGISVEWVMESLVANYNRAITAEPVRDKEGNPTGEFVYQGSVANKSLELIGKQIGMFKDNMTININTVNVLLGKIIQIIKENVDDIEVINKIQDEVKQLGS